MRAIALLLLTALSLPAADPVPAATDKLAADLVKQLGHPKYAVRETAAKKLLNLGSAAVTALRFGLASPDEEIRSRCETLLPKAQAAEWARRADTYLAATDAKRPRNLPLLAEYEAVIGKDKMDAGARELFAEMVRTNGDLLEKVAADRPKTKAACLARSKIILDDANGGDNKLKAKVGDLAAVLFVQTLEPKATSDATNRSSPGYLLTNPGMADGIGGKVVGTVFRRLVVRWIETRPAGDRFAQQQFIRASQANPFPEAGPSLIRVVRDKKADALTSRTPAIQALGGIKSPEAAAALADLISDKTSLFNFGIGQASYLMCDVALAASITMQGKKPEEFGLTNNISFGFNGGPGEDVMMLTLQGFQNDSDREKAVKKWKDESEKKK